MTGNKIGGYAAGWDFVDFKVCKGVKKIQHRTQAA